MRHVAPEAGYKNQFRRNKFIDYVSMDLSPCAMLRVDLTALCFPDDSFDVVHASHVLERIVEDEDAMREVFRVLKPGGWAILQVPIYMELEHTFEDWSVTTPAEREKLFG